MKKEKIVFFFPWKEVSGGPVYLTGLANALSEDPKYEVWYVDYADGLSISKLDCSRVRLVLYREPFTMPFYAPLTLVIPIYCAAHIPILHPDSRILFVNWHNYCIQALLDSWRLSKSSLQEFLNLVGKTNSECFVDRSHWLAQNEWYGPGCSAAPEQYVPLVIGPREYRRKEGAVHPGEMHIAVLGRLCKDKIFSVLNLLDQLNRLKTELERHLYVIGDGSEASLLRQAKTEEKVHLHMMGTLTGNKLQEFLAENVDALFGMGLSVLEGAAMGIPAVIMPHNVEPFQLDAYVFLQDSRGYATGWYDTQLAEMGVPFHPLSEILNVIYKPEAKAQLGQAALQYVKSNHADNRSAIEQALLRTRLTIRIFAKFRKKQGKVRLCGIPIARLTTSFDETQKTISFLGIRTFFKSENTEEGKRFFLFGKQQDFVSAKKEGSYFRIYIKGIRVPFLKL